MTSRLAGQKVVVFGGTSGIGFGVATAALEEGADVTIVGRDAARLERAAGRLGSRVRTARVDFGDYEGLRAFFAANAPIDHLVTTVHSVDALGGSMRPILDMDLESAERMLTSKYWAQFIILKLGAPYLSENGSITLTSGAASRGFIDFHGLLGPNNSAIETLARYAAVEFGPRRVNCVSPGLTNTPTFDDLPDAARRDMFKSFEEGVPVGYVAKPADIAGAFIYAMTNRYVSGAVIDIDGGFLFGLLKDNESRAHRILDRVTRAMAVTAGAIFAAMATLIVLSIAGRVLVPLGLAPIKGDFELVSAGCAIGLFFFLPWCQFQRGGIAVDVITEHFPYRVEAILGLLGDLLMTLIAAVMLWRLYLGFAELFPYGSNPIRSLFGMGERPFMVETTAELGIPLWIPYGFCVIGAVAFLMVGVYSVARAAVWVKEGQEALP